MRSASVETPLAAALRELAPAVRGHHRGQRADGAADWE